MALVGLATAPVSAGGKSTTFRFFFMDGAVLSGQLATTHLAVRAPDGTVRKLRSANVRSVTPGLAGRTELVARTRRLIEQLGAPSWHDRKDAHRALLRMGPAVSVLLEGGRKDADLERRLRIEDLLARFRVPQAVPLYTSPGPRCLIRADDRVTLHDSGEVISRPLLTRRVDVVSVYGRFSSGLGEINSIRRLAAAEAEPKTDKPDRITIALQGGKAVKGTLPAQALTLRTPRGKLHLPAEGISRLVFSPDRKQAGVVFRNGDHLFGHVLAPGAVMVKAPDGRTAKVPLASIRALTITPGFVPTGLIFWNRLDGSPSIVGPDVAFTDVDSFVPGKVAKGVQVSTTSKGALRVPSAMLDEAPAGTIAFWTKVVSVPAPKKPPPGKRTVTRIISYYEMLAGPVSLTCRSYSSRITPYVYLRCGGQMVRSDPRQKGQDAKTLLAPGRWNHVAIVWNVKGIKTFAGAPLAMLVNGKPFGTFVKNARAGDPMRDFPFPPHLVLHRSRSTTTRGPTVIYDELKIWNRVVTQFKR